MVACVHALRTYGARCLHTCAAMPGTDIAYGATRASRTCRPSKVANLLSCYTLARRRARSRPGV
eukprot:3052459-Rhodomonas_salina.3